jgi:hemerythrin-like domain-containing protein
MMIERIHREHGYMVRLLAILNKTLLQLDAEKTINYSVVKEVVNYLCDHSERTHHPKEDLIYNYFEEKYADQYPIPDLEQAHIELAGITHDFLEIVDMILQDAVVPREVFTQQLTQFINYQKKHLEIEERDVLPLINKVLTIKDWQYLEQQWGSQDEDPVFGETIADGYQQLAEMVKETENEAS